MSSRDFPVSASRGWVRLLVGTLVVSALPLAAHAQRLTLDEAVRRAVAQAPLVEARAAGVTAAREEAARSGALPDPVLTVGIDNLPVTGPDAFDATADMMTMKEIGVRQDIPAPAKRAARRTLAEREFDEAAAREAAERQGVRRSAADAWIAAWAVQQERHAIQGQREQAALAAKLARARLAGGEEMATNALAAQAAVLELDARLQGVQAEETAALEELARWLGKGDVETADTPPDFDTLPVTEATLLAGVDRTGPLLPATAEVETAAAAIDLARADKRVDWSLTASYGQRSGGRDDMLMFEVGIGLPVFPRNRQDRGIAAREADYQAALASREDLRRQMASRIRADVARWQGLKRQVALHEQALLPMAMDRSKVALAAYRAGGALQPWLDARRDELAVHLAHAEHLGELGRAWAALAYLLPKDQP